MTGELSLTPEVTGLSRVSSTFLDRLVHAGMSGPAAAAKTDLLRACCARIDAAPTHALFVPGRVEILGKHTDYAGGRSLLCAIDRGICAAVRPLDGARVRICDARHPLSVEFRLDRELQPTIGQWTNYPMTVARRIARNFGDGPLSGAEIMRTRPRNSSALRTGVDGVVIAHHNPD